MRSFPASPSISVEFGERYPELSELRSGMPLTVASIGVMNELFSGLASWTEKTSSGVHNKTEKAARALVKSSALLFTGVFHDALNRNKPLTDELRIQRAARGVINIAYKSELILCQSLKRPNVVTTYPSTNTHVVPEWLRKAIAIMDEIPTEEAEAYVPHAQNLADIVDGSLIGLEVATALQRGGIVPGVRKWRAMDSVLVAYEGVETALAQAGVDLTPTTYFAGSRRV